MADASMMNPFRFALPRALLLFLGSLPVFPVAIRANEQPPSDEARAAARHELALGRCAFPAKDYAQARSRFERAAELDPTEVIASLLVARTIRVQYRKGVETKANVALARAAIAAYEHVLVRDCDNSEAILAVADLYEQTGEEDTASLAGDGWACSHRITSKPGPVDPPEFKKAEECARAGMKMIDRAQQLDPRDSVAMIYKGLLLKERAAFARANGRERADYLKEAAEAQVAGRRLRTEELTAASAVDTRELPRIEAAKPRIPTPPARKSLAFSCRPR